MFQNKNQCAESCPGCSLINFSYDETLAYKRKYILKFLSRWENVISDIEHLDFTRNRAYRNKASLSAIYNDSKWFFGMMRRDELIPIHHCPVHVSKINDSIAFLVAHLPSFELFPLVNLTQVDNQIVLVLKTREMHDLNWLWAYINEIKKLGWETICLHLNPVAGKKVFHKFKWELVFGEKFCLNNGSYYTARAFQQLIPALYQHALQQATLFFKMVDESAIVDLYSGTGVSLQHWQRITDTIIGVELSGDAVACARLNNPHSLILQGTCVQRFPQIDNWLDKESDKGFCVFANPPRTGLEEGIIDWILKTLPLKIAYLSCSPATLQRDLQQLETEYEVKKIIPYDFFPFTRHVECLVLIEKSMPHNKMRQCL